MRWVRDSTGRFAQRPHYDLVELDAECEALVSAFLRTKYQTVRYPVTTNDLTVLLEQKVGNLDLYTDLSADGEGIEGATDFFPGRKPNVRIASSLSEDARRENRFRTTLAHELGHVHFHTFLWDMGQSIPMSLVGERSPVLARCHRDGMLGTATVDWLEWQAGYASGALLMPHSWVREVVRGLRDSTGTAGVVAQKSLIGQTLVRDISKCFRVSADAARVRLLKLRYLTDDAPTHPLVT